MIRVAILLISIFSATFTQSKFSEDLVLYTWTYNEYIHGTIWLPKGYIAETNNYTEGIITYLRYPDSSCIMLQHGGMFTIPMLFDSQYFVIKNEERNDRKVRAGTVKGMDLFWREDNLKRIEARFGKNAHFLICFRPISHTTMFRRKK